MRYTVLSLFFLISLMGISYSHTGDMDDNGGHYNYDGTYHIHNDKMQEGLPDDSYTATEDAKRDAAKLDVTPWSVGGFFFSIFAVGYASVDTPAVPFSRLIGKSPVYISTYERVYISTAKKRITNAAIGGCFVSGLVAVGYYLYSTGEL